MDKSKYIYAQTCVNGIHINPCPNYHLNNVKRSECMVNQFKQTQTSLHFIKKTILHKNSARPYEQE